MKTKTKYFKIFELLVHLIKIQMEDILKLFLYFENTKGVVMSGCFKKPRTHCLGNTNQ